MQIEERRNTQRAPIGVTVIEEYLSERQQVEAVDISEHGMYYCRPLGEKRNQGNEVFLTFSLLERLEPIKALGWVVEENETEQCVETHVTFMFLPDKDEEMIREFVLSHYLNAATV